MSSKRVFKQKVTRSTTNNSDGHILQFIALSGWVDKELGQIDAKPLFQIWTWIGSCSKPFQTRKWGLTVINYSLSRNYFFTEDWHGNKWFKPECSGSTGWAEGWILRLTRKTPGIHHSEQCQETSLHYRIWPQKHVGHNNNCDDTWKNERKMRGWYF